MDGDKASHYTDSVLAHRIDIKRKINSILRGREVDVVFEMSGASDAIGQSFDLVKRGGGVVLFGIPKEKDIQIQEYSSRIIFKGLHVKAVVGRKLYKSWEQTEAFLKHECNRALVRKIITDVYPYGEYQEAFDKILSGNAGKVVLDFSRA